MLDSKTDSHVGAKKPRKSGESQPPKHMRTPKAIQARIAYLEAEVADLRKRRDALKEDAKKAKNKDIYTSPEYTGLSTRIYNVKQSLQMWEKRLRKLQAEQPAK